jgi:hypothetical protein
MANYSRPLPAGRPRHRRDRAGVLATGEGERPGLFWGLEQG